MKEIRAYVREHMVTRVVDSLARDGILDFSVVEVRGIARGLPSGNYAYSVGLGEPFLHMVKIEVVCREVNVDRLVGLIREAASTGRPGDGVIFVSDVAETIRIRDGARGEEVLPL